MRPIAIVLTLALSASLVRADEQPPAPQPAPAAPAPAAAEPTPTPAPAVDAPAPTPATPAEQKPPEPAPAAPAKPGLVDDGKVSKMRIGAWVGVACTVATLTAGAIFGLASQARADEVSRRLVFVDENNVPRKFDESAQKDDKNLRHDGHLFNGLAIGFYSAAGALAVVTTTLFAVDYARRNRSKSQAMIVPTPLVGPNIMGLGVGGRF